jgi:Zn-dependent peptidase ImmA (M78 family)
LNEPGVSNLWPRGRISQDASKIETYCNIVAAELILPQNEFVPIWHKLDESEPLNDRIEKCSKHFKVSREVVARRLLIMQIITQDKYVELAEQFHREWIERKSREKAKKLDDNSYPHPYILKVINNGRAFSRVVLTAYQEGRISGRDTSDLLKIKLNKLSDYADHAGLGLQFRRVVR